MSIWNLIFISFDRYRCVCTPFKYMQATTKSWYPTLCIFLPALALYVIWGGSMQVKMEGGKCVDKFFLSRTVSLGFAVSTWVLFFLVPVIVIIVLYGNIINVMRKRQDEGVASFVIGNAAKQMTRTSVVVTLIFVACIGYDLSYYSLGRLEILEYKMNTPRQKIGVLVASLNNVCNPFVYFVLLPTYRRNTLDLFSSLCGIRKVRTSQTFSSMVSVTQM